MPTNLPAMKLKKSPSSRVMVFALVTIVVGSAAIMFAIGFLPHVDGWDLPSLNAGP